jgi:hypothetical protein
MEVNLFSRTTNGRTPSRSAYYFALGRIYLDLSRKNLNLQFEFNFEETDFLVTLDYYDLLDSKLSFTIEC